MAIDEAARHELYTRLEELLGQEPTSTLMSLLPPVGWADVASKDDLRMLGLEVRAEISEVRTELADFRTEVRGEISAVRTELAGFRADVADGQRRLALTLVGAMVSISGLTFAVNAVF